MYFTGGRQRFPNRKAESCYLGDTNTGDLSMWELILKPRFMGKPLTMIMQLALRRSFQVSSQSRRNHSNQRKSWTLISSMESIVRTRLFMQVYVSAFLRGNNSINISSTDSSCPCLNQVDYTVTFHRHVLLSDHLDHLLSDHATKESCSVGQLGKRCSSTA